MRKFQTIQKGNIDIYQRNIRLASLDKCERLLPVTGLSNYLHFDFFPRDGVANQTTDQIFVIYN